MAIQEHKMTENIWGCITFFQPKTFLLP